MRIHGSTAIRAAILAGLSLTLAAAAGGAGALAATTHPARPAASGVTWHKLNLINGWAAEPAALKTGTPSWAERNGIVYLSGGMELPSGSNTVFAVLPKAAWPAHSTYITVYTPGAYGNISISPAGVLAVFSPNPSSSEGFTSLAGVSYLAAATSPGHRLALRDSWQSGSTAFGAGNPSVTLRGNVVYLSGSVTGGGSPLFAVLPKADRPAHSIWLEVDTFGGVAGELEIFANGDMFASQGSATQFTSLAGVSFLAASVHRNTIKLINHWTSAQRVFNTGSPGYAVIDGIVYLSGGLSQGTGTFSQFATLPTAIRPVHIMYLHVYDAGALVGTVSIAGKGAIGSYNVPDPSAAKALTLLSGLSYPVNE